MPDECASIRSMARWVLPVLVGPRMAVTPAPRTRASRLAGEEKEMAIGMIQRTAPVCITMRRRDKPVLKLWNEFWNESRPNR